MEERDMKKKKNREVDQDILGAEKFCDDCVGAFGKTEIRKGSWAFRPN